ncbi:MAG: hypothetical protein IJE05_03820 [Clostridia bacterium]|nr:hypothetical protein [Clostridia bacterium]
MYNEPIKKISGIAQIKYIKYYEKEYDEDFEKILKEKQEKKQDEKKKKSKSKKEKANRERKKHKDIQKIYNMEASKVRDLEIYRKLEGKSLEEKSKHKSNPNLQVSKMMEAYNKNSREKIEPIITKKEEKDNEEQRSKKQEMEEFKKSLRAKAELDRAFEEFNKALVKKNLEERMSKKAIDRGYDR